MKSAEIYSVPLTITPAFGWRWRSTEDNVVSRDWFVFYRDCERDAQRRGYRVERAVAPAERCATAE
jgi:hypothetical protein